MITTHLTLKQHLELGICKRPSPPFWCHGNQEAAVGLWVSQFFAQMQHQNPSWGQ